MGQYYQAIVLSDNKTDEGHERVRFGLSGHDFGSGIKLMEHSWVGNYFVNAVAGFLRHQPQRLVWAGDYADPESGRVIVSDGEEYDATLYGLAPDPNTRPMATVDGEPAMYEGDPNDWNAKWNSPGAQYGSADVNVEVTVELTESPRYFVNHTKREYVDVEACPAFQPEWSDKAMTVHPLPLLTCEGNGRGGGDYHSYDWDRETGQTVDHIMPGQQFIGRWARDHIQACDEPPAGFTEIQPGFSEDPALIVKTDTRSEPSGEQQVLHQVIKALGAEQSNV
jgi:hypothetical protein